MGDSVYNDFHESHGIFPIFDGLIVDPKPVQPKITEPGSAIEQQVTNGHAKVDEPPIANGVKSSSSSSSNPLTNGVKA